MYVNLACHNVYVLLHHISYFYVPFGLEFLYFCLIGELRNNNNACIYFI